MTNVLALREKNGNHVDGKRTLCPHYEEWCHLFLHIMEYYYRMCAPGPIRPPVKLKVSNFMSQKNQGSGLQVARSNQISFSTSEKNTIKYHPIVFITTQSVTIWSGLSINMTNEKTPQ